MPGCRVEAITPDGPDLLHIDAGGTRPGGRCPDCRRASRVVHSQRMAEGCEDVMAL